MKRKISKSDFEALSDDLKKEYEAKGDSYVLKVEDDSGTLDIDHLLGARDALQKAKEAAAKEEREAKEKLRLEREEIARKEGDWKALEASLKERHDAELKAERAKADGMRKTAGKALLSSTAEKMAGELFTSSILGLPHIMARLRVEYGQDDASELASIRVLDKDGKPSAATIDDLRKEFLTDTAFSSILKGSNASGGRKDSNPLGGRVGETKIKAESGSITALPLGDKIAALDESLKHTG